MIKPEQVPKEAIAELRAFMNSCDCDDCVSAAIAAALSAWPGMEYVFRQPTRYSVCYSKPALILPLPPQENSDE